MDQDKAQQSIDTLSEKVNGVVRSVRVSVVLKMITGGRKTIVLYSAYRK